MTDNVIDFSEVSGLEPLPAGRYAFEITTAKPGISINSGQPKVDVQLSVTEPENYAGRIVFDTLSFHPNALPFTKEKLVNLGLGDFAGSPEDLAEELLDLDGVVSITIEESEQINPDTGEPYDPRNRVRRYYPAGTELETGVGGLD